MKKKKKNEGKFPIIPKESYSKSKSKRHHDRKSASSASVSADAAANSDLHSVFKVKLEALRTVPEVGLSPTASPFAVFAAVRKVCLDNKKKRSALLQLQSEAVWNDLGVTSTGDGGDGDGEEQQLQQLQQQLPKIVGIGLRGVFELIRESHQVFPDLCQRSLQALLDILQGESLLFTLTPNDLSN